MKRYAQFRNFASLQLSTVDDLQGCEVAKLRVSLHIKNNLFCLSYTNTTFSRFDHISSCFSREIQSFQKYIKHQIAIFRNMCSLMLSTWKWHLSDIENLSMGQTRCYQCANAVQMANVCETARNVNPMHDELTGNPHISHIFCSDDLIQTICVCSFELKYL
jgi:hypothetical protein